MIWYGHDMAMILIWLWVEFYHRYKGGSFSVLDLTVKHDQDKDRESVKERQTSRLLCSHQLY